ncbi:MFS transporter [Saccharomonospora sp. NB11]|jgi:predicted MFS family arabinose efflux permease|uniref:MFS transporter n=1 Tax=Saccharomonospora sp. NB11 TaxID=1642298 RepID=UPI0018D12149|nr:MFS transporter [Saccharomonospora sp. NB11]
MVVSPSTAARSTRGITGIAAAAGGAFGSFYCFYAAAPVFLVDAQPSPGVLVSAVLLVVVLVQPVVVLAGRWTRVRARTVTWALATMATGLTVLATVDVPWFGLGLLGLGFGVFVIAGTAWARDVAADEVGRALGIYGFGSALGGAIGAPVGLLLATLAGPSGVVIGGVTFAVLGLLAVMAVPCDVTTGNAPSSSASTTESRPRTVPVVLLGHVLAVTLYAAVLSSLGPLLGDTSATLTVAAAFAVQSAVALGRLVGGVLCDRWSVAGTAALSVAVLVVATIGFAASSAAGVLLPAATLIGAASGAVQTATLTSMMRRVRSPAHTDRTSAAWNVAFDVGLGLGALTASL